jgi:hypothetical protein
MEKPASGSFKLPTIDEDLGAVGYRVHVELDGLLKTFGFERVFYEMPIPPSRMLGNTQLHVTAKVFTIAGHIESFCYAKRLRCRQVGQSSWRRTFVGKGAGEKTKTFKDWSMRRCRELGWNVRSHDEADACGILDYGISLDPSFTPPWRDKLLFAEQFQGKPRRSATA